MNSIRGARGGVTTGFSTDSCSFGCSSHFIELYNTVPILIASLNREARILRICSSRKRNKSLLLPHFSAFPILQVNFYYERNDEQTVSLYNNKWTKNCIYFPNTINLVNDFQAKWRENSFELLHVFSVDIAVAI